MLMTAPSKDGVKPKKNTVTDNLENKQPSNIPEINELCNKTFNSAADCAKSIVRSIWTQEELKDRVVRQTRGISKKVLTPEKVVKGKEMFASWLKKVGYMKDARNIELKQFNTHIGRVIDGAKKVDANKLKRKLEIDTNGTPPEKTPSKDLCEKSNNE
ncbi:uncharacterized protein LOC122859529 [Aphidius gifuensis]|nr:uncharacterized protein LOC122859529 [Aphidius gifuensis]